VKRDGVYRGFSITPDRGSLGIELRELLEYRYLFWRMLVRPIQVRYRQTVLGVAWAVIRPLVSMVVFTVFFGKLLGVEKRVDTSYWLFVLTGLLPWGLAAATVTAASASTVNHAHLITKVYFPRILVPLSVVGWTGLDFFVGALAVIPLMVWDGVVPGPSLLLMPVILLLIVGCSMAVGVFFSALNIRYRDFAHAMPFLVQIWFFLTPVIYPAKVVPERFRPLAEINPMTGLISAFRSCLLGTPVNFGSLGISSGLCVVMLACALWYFSRVEGFFADVV